jgi:hypothetical protein
MYRRLDGRRQPCMLMDVHSVLRESLKLRNLSFLRLGQMDNLIESSQLATSPTQKPRERRDSAQVNGHAERARRPQRLLDRTSRRIA